MGIFSRYMRWLLFVHRYLGIFIGVLMLVATTFTRAAGLSGVTDSALKMGA
jgi:hypothetical protein